MNSEVENLAARLPDSLSLGASTPDDSPGRNRRSRVDHHKRKRDGVHRSHRPPQGQSGTQVVNDPRAKTKIYGVRAFQ